MGGVNVRGRGLRLLQSVGFKAVNAVGKMVILDLNIRPILRINSQLQCFVPGDFPFESPLLK